MFYSEVWERAQGAKVWIKGKEYIDFTSGGIFCANLGNNNLNVWGKTFNCAFMSSYRYNTEIRQRYREKLLNTTGYEDVAFFSDGSMAIEAALRVMRSVKGFSDCFHGKTKGASEIDPHGTLYLHSAPLYDYIIEGYRGYDAHFWSDGIIDGLKKAQKKGSLICFDEIQSGFWRTGKMFAYEHYDIIPDLLVLGKAIGNGFPLSALLTRDKKLFDGIDLSCTHGGNPMAMAAGLAVLEEFKYDKEGYHTYSLSNVLRVMRENLACKAGDTCPKVNGRGMVAALICKDKQEADEIYTEAFKKRLLLVHTGKNTVKIGPPLTISPETLTAGLKILEEVLHDTRH